MQDNFSKRASSETRSSIEAHLLSPQQKLMGAGDEPFRPPQLRDGF
jgi:hypothetical protein